MILTTKYCFKYMYCTARNFHQEKKFCQFHHLSSLVKSLSTNFYIVDMMTFTALAKILSLENYYNTKIVGLGENVYSTKIFSYTVLRLSTCLVMLTYMRMHSLLSLLHSCYTVLRSCISVSPIFTALGGFTRWLKFMTTDSGLRGRSIVWHIFVVIIPKWVEDVCIHGQGQLCET